MNEVKAKSGNISDVQEAVRAAKEGDAVIIPKGKWDWQSQLVINGGTFNDGSSRGKSVSLFGEEEVTVTNNYKVSNTWQDQPLIRIHTGPEELVRIKNIGFEEGPRLAGGGSIGHAFMHVSYKANWGQGNEARNTGKPMLLHNCSFDMKGNTSFGVRLFHRGGVIYDCSFKARGTGSEVGIVYQGEGSWGQPSTFGILDTTGIANTYVEDCSFTDFINGYSFDCSGGSRFVIRANKFNRSLIGSHGLESDPMGMRHAEVYHNSFERSGSYCWIHMRGGSWVVHNNSFDAGPGSAIIMTITALNRRAVAFAPACPTIYPIPRQIGQGWSGGEGSYEYVGYPQFGRGNITEPCCIWKNDSKTGQLIGFTDDPDTCGNRLFTRNFLREGRDYLLTAKSDYTPYTYPHPLREGKVVEPPVVVPPEPPVVVPPEPPSVGTYNKWLASLANWIEANPPHKD